MKCKNRMIILFLLVFVICGCGKKDEEIDVKETVGDSFTVEKTYSYDGEFYAICEVTQDNEMMTEYITVVVYNKEDREVDSFEVARKRDFWGICWENNNYNIWVQSGDVGVICYREEEGVWHRDENAKRPEDIVSKYDD